MSDGAGGAEPMAGAMRAAALADRDTPLVRNAWYVAATSAEVTRAPMRRQILGQDVMLYRRQDGAAVALHNRCAHRSFPLHLSALEGDLVVCGYHGVAYGPDGRAVRIPSDPRPEACANVFVHAYPVIEDAPFVWIWTGEAAAADPAARPLHPWLSDPAWAHGAGYTRIAASYVGLHENLMDLTHFSFLHAGNVGTPEYASAPYDLERAGDRVRVLRKLEDQILPSLYDKPMDLVGVKVDRVSDSNFEAPGWHAAHASVVDRATGRVYRTEILHAITPETQTSTHYFWVIARDYAVADASVTAYHEAAIIQAFEEDRVALEWAEKLAAEDQRAEFYERSFAADRGGLAMRRVLARLAAAERAS